MFISFLIKLLIEASRPARLLLGCLKLKAFELHASNALAHVVPLGLLHTRQSSLAASLTRPLSDLRANHLSLSSAGSPLAVRAGTWCSSGRGDRLRGGGNRGGSGGHWSGRGGNGGFGGGDGRLSGLLAAKP